MRRFVILGFYLLVLTMAFTKFGIASNGFEMHVPMGTLVLEPPSSVEPKRANVVFPHSKHFIEISCHTCHHDWKGTNPIIGCTTSGCHDSPLIEKKTKFKDKKIESNLNIKYYKKAYHKQCIGCHKIMKEESEKIEYSMKNISKKISSTGPTGCVECHPK